MKKLHFKTSKGEFILLELPEGATELHIFNDINLPYLSYRLKHETGRVYLSEDGHWKLFGNIEQLTEEQVKEVIGGISGGMKVSSPQSSYIYKLNRLLQSLDVHFENPLSIPDPNDDYYRDAMGLTYEYFYDYELWLEAQSKLWNKSNTYLFRKV